jgi:hypothetical protein
MRQHPSELESRLAKVDENETRRPLLQLKDAFDEIRAKGRADRPLERLLAVSLNADAYQMAEGLRQQLGFAEDEQIHVDLRRFASTGRARPEELQAARKEAFAQLEATNLRSLRGRLRLHAKAQIPLVLWLGWYLQKQSAVIAYNLRGGELIPFQGPADPLPERMRGGYETMEQSPPDLAAEPNDSAVVLVDLTGKSTSSDLARFQPDPETPHRYRLLLKEPRNLEEADLLPILRDVIKLFALLKDRGIQTYHLAFAGPDVITFFLGQQLNARGRVRLYERYADHYEYVFDLES